MTQLGRFLVLLALAPLAASGDDADVARAYIQAITQGSGAQAADGIDYAALGCTPRTVWEDACQQAVLNGKDGKTLFMESITPVASADRWRESNIAWLLPESDLRAVYTRRLSPTQQMFANLSGPGNGWYSGLEGDGNAKSLLRSYIQHVSSTVDLGESAGNLYTWLSGPFSGRAAQDLRATAAQIDLRIDRFDEVRPMSGLYFWALQVSMTDMRYPEGYSDIKPECLNSTTAWGHVGLQYHASTGRKAANWGGGGQGDGTADYGCGGSDVSDFAWQVGAWYRLSVYRGERLAEQLWQWHGRIEGGSGEVYDYAIHGGEYLVPHGFVVWTEAIDLYCQDPPAVVSWGRPRILNEDGLEFEVTALNASYSNEQACGSSNQTLTGIRPSVWTQEMGAGTVRRTANHTNLLGFPAPPQIDVN